MEETLHPWLTESNYLSTSTKLFVGNLKLDTTEQELEDHFGEYGPLREVVVLPVKAGRESEVDGRQRCAMIVYQESKDAYAALSATDRRPMKGQAPEEPAECSGRCAASASTTVPVLVLQQHRQQQLQQLELGRWPPERGAYCVRGLLAV